MASGEHFKGAGSPFLFWQRKDRVKTQTLLRSSFGIETRPPRHCSLTRRESLAYGRPQNGPLKS